MIQRFATLIFAALLVGCAAQCDSGVGFIDTLDNPSITINLNDFWTSRVNGPADITLFSNGSHLVEVNLVVNGGAFVNSWDLDSNGAITIPSIGMYAYNDPNVYNTMTFQPPATAFLAKLNYSPDYPDFGYGTPIIEVIDINENLECYDIDAILPISTPDALNGYEFRGVRRDYGIKALRFRGGQIIFWDISVEFNTLTEAPSVAPVNPPTDAPVGAPVEAPVEAPVASPGAPMASPVAEPIAPVAAPVKKNSSASIVALSSVVVSGLVMALL